MFICHRQAFPIFLLSIHDRRPAPILWRQRPTLSDFQLLPTPTALQERGLLGFVPEDSGSGSPPLSVRGVGARRHARPRSFIGARTSAGSAIDCDSGV